MSHNLSKISAYVEFFNDIKSRIQGAQIKASRSVSRIQIELYWSIGKSIVFKQQQLGWGKSVVERLSKDLKRDLLGATGYSTQNLWYMRQFYLEYQANTNLQQLAGEIPWFSNVIIFSKVKDDKARLYYLKATAEFGWSRNVLLNQIKAKAYERQQIQPKTHNFAKVLPEHLAEQANEAIKDVYMLDFLGITEPVLEREMESRMVRTIKDFLLELGYGFAFLGNQYRIKANGKEYFIDLLFYHRRLKSLVAFELKTGPFKPEYAGKMNFYLNLLDDFVREKDENPSLGIILCAHRDHFEVEYALRNLEQPVGVAEYSLTSKLPSRLVGQLPGVDELMGGILKRKGLI